MMEDSHEIVFRGQAGGVDKPAVDSGMGETCDATQLLLPEVTLTEGDIQPADVESVQPTHTSAVESPKAPTGQILLDMYADQKQRWNDFMAAQQVSQSQSSDSINSMREDFTSYFQTVLTSQHEMSRGMSEVIQQHEATNARVEKTEKNMLTVTATVQKMRDQIKRMSDEQLKLRQDVAFNQERVEKRICGLEETFDVKKRESFVK